MTAAGVARALHGKRHARGFLCRCPVPSHGQGRGDRNPSLSVADGDNGGLIVTCFSGCDSLDVLQELRDRGLDDDRDQARPCKPIAPSYARPAPDPEPEPDARAVDLWNRAAPATETLVVEYLRWRGITLPPPPTLRFVPDLDSPGLVMAPAMIAAVQRPDRKVVAVQVTWLDPAGRGRDRSRDRKTIGKLGSGSVRLGPAGETIGLAEGVETALAAMQIFGVPVWACLGSSRMCGLTLPAECRKLILFGDNDQPGVDAVKRSVEKYRLLRAVSWEFPPEGCGDFADEAEADLGVCDE